MLTDPLWRRFRLCLAMCCSVLHVLQCVAVCCSMLQFVAVHCSALRERQRDVDRSLEEI